MRQQSSLDLFQLTLLAIHNSTLAFDFIFPYHQHSKDRKANRQVCFLMRRKRSANCCGFAVPTKIHNRFPKQGTLVVFWWYGECESLGFSIDWLYSALVHVPLLIIYVFPSSVHIEMCILEYCANIRPRFGFVYIAEWFVFRLLLVADKWFVW